MQPVAAICSQAQGSRIRREPVRTRLDPAPAPCSSSQIRRSPDGRFAWPAIHPAQRRAGAVRLVGACIFLLISRRARPHSILRDLSRLGVALHNSIVNNNANTMADPAGTARPRGRTDWVCLRNRFPRRECSAARGISNNPEQTRLTTCVPMRGASNARTAAGRPPEACRSLLIYGPRPPAEPVRSGGSSGARHGQRPPCRPPSPLTESGGRP